MRSPELQADEPRIQLKNIPYIAKLLALLAIIVPSVSINITTEQQEEIPLFDMQGVELEVNLILTCAMTEGPIDFRFLDTYESISDEDFNKLSAHLNKVMTSIKIAESSATELNNAQKQRNSKLLLTVEVLQLYIEHLKKHKSGPLQSPSNYKSTPKYAWSSRNLALNSPKTDFTRPLAQAIPSHRAGFHRRIMSI
ncbi:MAG: hypothetical protein WCT53_01815 [Candidatus Gracilibacteria bacterium]